jgi:hypothetical protein
MKGTFIKMLSFLIGSAIISGDHAQANRLSETKNKVLGGGFSSPMPYRFKNQRQKRKALRQVPQNRH